MTYKDPDKQREANRERQRRYKAKQKALLSEGVTADVTEEALQVLKQADEIIAETDAIRAVPATLLPNMPTCEKPKRGKDIKCFEDLPPDVQQTIDAMSVVEGKIDQTIKANRTAIAIHYQHLFPDRYHSTGIAI